MTNAIAEAFVTLRPDLSKFQGETESKMGGTLKKVAIAAGGVIGTAKAFQFLTGSIRDAADENQGIEVLATTLRKSAGATDVQTAAVERWVTKMQNATGIMDDELRPALGKLVISGRSVSQAEKDIGVAADIAAARHVSLTTVVQAMSKAALGNVAGLARLGLATKSAAGETLAYDQVLQQASKTMGGAAAAAADTAAGRAAILQAKFADLKENIGNALLPIMETLTSALSSITGWFNNLSPGMQKVVLVAVALVASIGPMVALIQNITLAVKGLSIAMKFLGDNGIFLVIAGLAALAVGLVYAYKHSETFRNIVDGALRAVAGAATFLKDVFVGAFTWIKQHIDLVLLAMGPLGWGIVLLKNNWETVWKAVHTAISAAWKIIKPILHAIKEAVDDVAGPLGKVLGAAGKVGGAVGGALKHIPGFAAGGRPMGLSIVGERGPELWVPDGPGTIVPNHALGRGVSIGELHQHFNGQVDPNRVASSTNQGLRDAAWLMGA